MAPSCHHPASFLTHAGIVCAPLAVPCDCGMTMIPFCIMYCKPFMKSLSPTWPSCHHFAVFFIHPGITIVCVVPDVPVVPEEPPNDGWVVIVTFAKPLRDASGVVPSAPVPS